MAHVIAVAGKGGVGKTTLCGMLIQYLCEKKKGPVLAVDADANSNLNEVLGVEVDTTLGDVREEIAHAEMTEKSPIPKITNNVPVRKLSITSVPTGKTPKQSKTTIRTMGSTEAAASLIFSVMAVLSLKIAALLIIHPIPI